MTENLGDYALLGDLHTVALVSSRGSLDWLCPTRFDSTACFAALTRGRRGGTWVIAPDHGGKAPRRRYRRGTLVLESEWDTQDGSVSMVECMAPRTGDSPVARIVRVVEGVSGRVPMHVLFEPRFDHGYRTPWLRCAGTHVSAVAGSDALWLDTSVPLTQVTGHSAAEAQFTVTAGQRIAFVLTCTPSDPRTSLPPDPLDLVEMTERFWSTWSAGIDSAGTWDDAVRQAMITMKALTCASTGAVVTGPVFPAGNTPYLCDLVDASSTLRALLDAGLTDEARALREWLLRAVAGVPGDAATRYTVDGRGDPSTRTDSRGTVGEILRGVNAADHLWLPSRDPSWDLQLDLLHHLESTWDQPVDDQNGIGEPASHQVISKVRAWAGLDRAMRTARRHGLPGPVERWQAARSRLRAEVCTRGYDPDRNTFTRYYGSDIVDPALLLIPETGFLPWQDARIRGTVAAVTAALTTTSTDGLRSLAPGTRLTAGFRLATALRATGEPGAASALFEQLLAARNDVGLFGEFYDREVHRIGLTPSTASAVSMLTAARRMRPAPAFTAATYTD